MVLDSSNDTDPNAQYHDFRAWTNDPRPDWYFEQMVTMRWNNRVGFMGYETKELRNMATSGRSVGIYRGLIYDLTSYIENGPSTPKLNNEVLPGSIDVQFMHPDVINVFQYSSGRDVTKQLDSLNIGEDVLNWQRTCLRNLFPLAR